MMRVSLPVLGVQVQIRVLSEPTSGLVDQNQTPDFALPLLRWFDRSCWIGVHCTLAGTVADDARAR
jgi:hypothetical protein